MTTIPTDQQAFLDAILANPQDDVVRLVFADWLEENDQGEKVCPECNGHGTLGTLVGEHGCYRCSPSYKERGTGVIPSNGFRERAEFIRVQIKSVQMEENGEPCDIDPEVGHTCFEQPCLLCESVQRYFILRQEAAELLSGDYGRNWRHWAAKAIELVPPKRYYYDHIFFRRGFIEKVYCTLSDWLTHGPAIVREHPIEVVKISGLHFRRTDDTDEDSWGTYFGYHETYQLLLDMNIRGHYHFGSEEEGYRYYSEKLIEWAKEQVSRPTQSQT